MTTSTNNTASFSNLHVSGAGYINRPRLVQPKRGDAFFACDLCLLEGKDGEQDKTYFQAIVVGSRAKEIFEKHVAPLEGNRDAKIFAVVKTAGIQPETFEGAVYENGQKTDKMETKVTLKTRLIQIVALNINGERIDLDPAADAAQDVVSDHNVEAASVETEVVTLDKADPNFEGRKADIKARGGKWNPEIKAWEVPVLTAA